MKHIILPTEKYCVLCNEKLPSTSSAAESARNVIQWFRIRIIDYEWENFSDFFCFFFHSLFTQREQCQPKNSTINNIFTRRMLRLRGFAEFSLGRHWDCAPAQHWLKYIHSSWWCSLSLFWIRSGNHAKCYLLIKTSALFTRNSASAPKKQRRKSSLVLLKQFALCSVLVWKSKERKHKYEICLCQRDRAHEEKFDFIFLEKHTPRCYWTKF